MTGVVDYGMGNLHSIIHKLHYIGARTTVITGPDDFRGVDRIILPGVGHFAKGMHNLRESGLLDALDSLVQGEGLPVLGICLGAQLLCRDSQESDNGRVVQGLGWIDGHVRRFDADRMHCRLKVPHMGWNTLRATNDSPLFTDLDAAAPYYFVHSYHLSEVPAEQVAAVTDYGYSFVSAVRKGNIHGTQFHPEKSHMNGLDLLDNFLELC